MSAIQEKENTIDPIGKSDKITSSSKSSSSRTTAQPTLQELQERNEIELTQILRFCSLKTRNNREQNYQISMDVEEFSPIDDEIGVDEEERKERKSFWTSLFYEQHLKQLEIQKGGNNHSAVDQQMEDDLLYFVRKKKRLKAEESKEENINTTTATTTTNNSNTTSQSKSKSDKSTSSKENSPAVSKKNNNGNSNDNNNNNTSPPELPSFFVKRKHAVNWKEILEDESIEWEQTFFLNLLLHRFHYTMEVSVRNKRYDEEKKRDRLITLKRVAKKVYATPSKVNMEDSKKKAETVEYTYPLIYFAIDDFDVAWKDIALAKDGELVCVELFATGDFFAGPSSSTPWNIRTRLFAGALDYEVILKEYNNKKYLWTSPTMNQFFKLQGPNGKGAAQMAVCTQVGITAADLNRPNRSSSNGDLLSPASNENSPSSSPSTLGRLGNAFRKLSFTNLATKATPVLNCSLTFLNMRWDLIIRDLLAATKKALVVPQLKQQQSKHTNQNQRETEKCPDCED